MVPTSENSHSSISFQNLRGIRRNIRSSEQRFRGNVGKVRSEGRSGDVPSDHSVCIGCNLWIGNGNVDKRSAELQFGLRSGGEKVEHFRRILSPLIYTVDMLTLSLEFHTSFIYECSASSYGKISCSDSALCIKSKRELWRPSTISPIKLSMIGGKPF